jgi:two-component system, chemotaxis family, protein-glutamate methylesterase/glutaminase
MSAETMRRRDVVVVGASAGGVEALTRFVRHLPPDFPGAIFVVLHVSPSGSVLPAILGRATNLPVTHAIEGETIQPGRIYVAPPDRHLLVEPHRVRVLPGPRQNGHRPGIDPLFRTAAWAYGYRVVGVLLSGTLDDGTLGLQAIKRDGGLSLVQDPDDALYRSMPESAITHDAPDLVGSATELAEFVTELAANGGDNSGSRLMEAEDEGQLRRVEDALEGRTDTRDGELAPYTCPECNGNLWEVNDGGLIRFTCRVGHSYSEEAMLSAQGTAVEAALWGGYRALEERIALKRRLARRLAQRGATASAHRLEEEAVKAEEHAAVMRQVLEQATEPQAGEEPAVSGSA